MFLITTWHNVSGRNPLDGSPLHGLAAIPNNLRLFAFSPETLANRFVKTFDLYDDGVAVWYEHPEFAEKVDVIAMALAGSAEFQLYPLNEYATQEVELRITQQVFVPGYPFRPEAANYWSPIWKSGTVASEPQIDWDGKPCLLIDAATKSGMSGAPVISHELLKVDGNSVLVSASPSSGFAGVYAGRKASKDAAEVQLGRVWKPRVVDEIIDGRKLSRLRFDGTGPDIEPSE